jgi:hypothetical protein
LFAAAKHLPRSRKCALCARLWASRKPSQRLFLTSLMSLLKFAADKYLPDAVLLVRPLRAALPFVRS